MKYASIDLETTGVEEKAPEHILMLSVVVEDPANLVPVKELPHFTCFIKYDKISGEPYALAMNAWILDIISGRKKNTTEYPIYEGEHWKLPLHEFLSKHFGPTDKIPFAGKNIGTFDLNFLPPSVRNRASHRIIDPAMKFTDLLNDKKVADLATCKARAGLDPTVSHDAREDAMDIISTLRTTYGKN